MADKLIDITEQNFQAEVLESDVPVLIDFWATWCAPCLAITPIIEELADEYQGRMKFAKLNVDDAPRLAMQYQVRSIPTLLVVRDGHVVAQRVGAGSKEVIRALVEKGL